MMASLASFAAPASSSSLPSTSTAGLRRQPLFGASDLPIEMFEKIILNLDAEDFMAASLVSKGWNEAMANSAGIKANFDMKIFIKRGGTRVFSAMARYFPMNSGHAGAIRPVMERLQRQIKEADQNLKDERTVRRMRRSNLDMMDFPEVMNILTEDIRLSLERTNTLFKDADFENNVFAFGALLRSAAVVVRLDTMRPLVALRNPEWRISRCRIKANWILLGIEPNAEVNGPDPRRANRISRARGFRWREDKRTEIWNWSAPEPTKVVSLAHADVRLFPQSHTLMPSSLVGLNADKTTLHVWRFRGDDTKDEPVLSINAFPEYAKTHVWEEFNVDGRNLIAAKKSLNAGDPSHALSVVVYDLISGDLLWTVRRLPCRSLDRRCSNRPSVFLTSYLAEVDVTHGNNSSIIVIDTRAARANHLQAVAFRSPHGAVLNYDEGDADYGLFEDVKIRDKAAYNRVNEHRGNPWLIARRDHYQSSQGVFNVEYIYKLAPFSTPSTFASSALRPQSSQDKSIVGHFCILKAERAEHSNEWLFSFKDYFPAH